MSQEINNREYRKQAIKDLLKQLHAGKSVDEVKAQFEEAFGGVAASEISEAEQALISEGLPVSEVQRLCDVHAAVFKGSVDQIHAPRSAEDTPGHPAHTLKAENRAAERLISRKIRPHIEALRGGDADAAKALKADLVQLAQLDTHYVKKEMLLFPYMEKYGITAPPKVMWGVDDEIRGMIRQAAEAADAGSADAADKAEAAADKAAEMIFKEENILLPMLLEVLTGEEWQHIAEQSEELGWCLIPRPPVWKPEAEKAKPAPAAAQAGDISMPTGFLSAREVAARLDTLPVDITFVGKDDTVRYFSQTAERVFPRTRAIIGRKVSDCHPPASVHIVEGIVEDFKSGKKTHEDFWIRMGGKYVYIRYFAVRDAAGEYLGVLEVTQDIAPIQEITGEKRLVSQE
jgi:DUF438 domain-containing protein